MNIVAIIPARMGSTRLPGKVLADVGGRSMLGRVCGRVARAALVDQLVVATAHSEGDCSSPPPMGCQPEDQPIVDECRRLGVACFQGSQQDVLDRYHQAATAYGADAVVRITADCPLIDPEVIDRVVRAFLEKRGQAPSYASNTLRRTWPRGLDTEVISAAALARAWREATEPYQRTHVTPYIYQHPERFRLRSVTTAEDFSDARWTVDLPEDLEFVRAVYRRLGEKGDRSNLPGRPGGCFAQIGPVPFFETFSWHDVRRLLAREPDIGKLNRHVRQKSLAEG